MKFPKIVGATVLVASFILAPEPLAVSAQAPNQLTGIHKIQHVVVIMQENRSFDNYFGTFPGAEGFPPNVCIPDPDGPCVRPYHDTSDVDGGGPHGYQDAVKDFDNGKMDGFVRQARTDRGRCANAKGVVANAGQDQVAKIAACGPQNARAVMSYHDARDIPNYWTWASNFVLQDHMFGPNFSGSWAAHLYEVSAWAAICKSATNPMSCVGSLKQPKNTIGPYRVDRPDLAAAQRPRLLGLLRVQRT